MLGSVEDFDPLYSTTDGSFNVNALKTKEDSTVSYDELVSLQNELTKEIMSRPEWKEVEVPAGMWVIGKDIPAGVYSLRPKESWDVVTFKYFPYSDNEYYDFFVISDKIGKFNFEDGLKIELSGTTIFAPPISPIF